MILKIKTWKQLSDEAIYVSPDGNLAFKDVVPYFTCKMAPLCGKTVEFEDDKITTYFSGYIIHISWCEVLSSSRLTNTQIKEHLKIIYNRLINIHGEDEKCDYMLNFKKIIGEMS